MTSPDGIARWSPDIVSNMCLPYCSSGGGVVHHSMTDLGHFMYSWVVLMHKAFLGKHWMGEKL